MYSAIVASQSYFYCSHNKLKGHDFSNIWRGKKLMDNTCNY